MSYKKKVRTFLSTFIQHNNFKDDDHLFEKGYVSSLMAMELVVFLESEFSIQIGNDDLKLENFKSVTAICSLIENKLN